MVEGFVPDTDDVRNRYATVDFSTYETSDADLAEFDRWLTKHDAEVGKQALLDAADAAYWTLVQEKKTLGMPTDEWLRARANG